MPRRAVHRGTHRAFWNDADYEHASIFGAVFARPTRNEMNDSRCNFSTGPRVQPAPIVSVG